jgi:glutamine amidotransferase
VIDTGLCNLDSMMRALELCGGRPVVCRAPNDLHEAERLVLPGVGAFDIAMDRFERSGFAAAVRSAASKGVPVLGVCLGMQMLADAGTEGGRRPGLGLVRGEVIAMTPSTGEPMPHIGWNEVHHDGTSPFLADIVDGTDFYFVHSYRFVPSNTDDVIAKTPYGGGFASVVGCGKVFGVQFHPEKSRKPGFKVLTNFLSVAILKAC